MLNCIHSLKHQDDINSNTEIWRRHVEGMQDVPSECTFWHWVKSGSKFAAVAVGSMFLMVFIWIMDDVFSKGSVYILIIIACAQLRP